MENFVDQRQEHEEHEAGVGTEFQNSYAASKATAQIVDDTKKIQKARKQGKYVVVSEADVCCQITDALIGRNKRMIAVFDTREEAVASLNGSIEDQDLYIVDPPKKRKSDEPQPFWNADRIKGICSDSEGVTVLENGKSCPNSFIIYRLLQALYKYQTAEEQSAGVTNKLNNVGFSGVDSVFLSSVAQSSQKYGRLTPKQARAVGRSLKKYAATQLAPLAQEAAANVPDQAPKAGYNTAEAEQARQVQTQSRPVQLTSDTHFGHADVAEQLAAKKADDPEGYYDPFGEGERLSEEEAVQFWTKRFTTQPYVRK